MTRPATAAPPWSAAPSFFDVVGTALGSPVEFDVGDCVTTGVVDFPEVPEVPVLNVTFSWKIPGITVGKLELDGDDGTMELNELLHAEELSCVLSGELDDGGGGEDDGAEEGEDDDDEPPVEPSVLKTTILALWPLGTVTTQNSAPPTPFVETGLFSPPMPSSAGLMEQGRPLQPPPSHSILTPYVGFVWHRSEAVQIGFQAILT